jgi:hypothetical protein
MERRIAMFAFALAAAVSALAQTETGTITGSVVDPGGRSVPKTQVQLINQSTGDVRTTLTESSGDFVFTPVLPGKYTVSVTAPGFKQFQRTDLVLTASERLSAGVLALQVGSVNESITVVAETKPVQTTSAERSGLINDKQTAQLLTIGRDITSLLRVLPGVAGGDGSSSLGTFGMPTINGVHNEYNTATIDGVVGNTRGYNNLDTPPNLDAIAEVKVLSSNYQAEYGKAAGAVISVVTKSGTQQFHGTGYYYVRNEDSTPTISSTISTVSPGRATATIRSAATWAVPFTGRANSTRTKTNFSSSSPRNIFRSNRRTESNTTPCPRNWNGKVTSPRHSTRPGS